MKKIISLLALTVAMYSGFAQSRTAVIDRQLIQSTDTSTDADTVIIAFNNIGSHLKSLQVSVYKLSGADTGTIYVQYTINGNDWVSFDSLSVNGDSITTKIFTVTNTTGNSYRAWYQSTGTQTSNLSFAYLRRADE